MKDEKELADVAKYDDRDLSRCAAIRGEGLDPTHQPVTKTPKE